MKPRPGDKVIFPKDLVDSYLNNSSVNIIRNSVGVILTMDEYVAALQESLGIGEEEVVENARKHLEKYPYLYAVRLIKVAPISESEMPPTWDFECVEGDVHIVSEDQFQVIEKKSGQESE